MSIAKPAKSPSRRREVLAWRVGYVVAGMVLVGVVTLLIVDLLSNPPGWDKAQQACKLVQSSYRVSSEAENLIDQAHKENSAAGRNDFTALQMTVALSGIGESLSYLTGVNTYRDSLLAECITAGLL